MVRYRGNGDDDDSKETEEPNDQIVAKNANLSVNTLSIQAHKAESTTLPKSSALAAAHPGDPRRLLAQPNSKRKAIKSYNLAWGEVTTDDVDEELFTDATAEMTTTDDDRDMYQIHSTDIRDYGSDGYESSSSVYWIESDSDSEKDFFHGG